jgi:hypothetical protein
MIVWSHTRPDHLALVGSFPGRVGLNPRGRIPQSTAATYGRHHAFVLLPTTCSNPTDLLAWHAFLPTCSRLLTAAAAACRVVTLRPDQPTLYHTAKSHLSHTAAPVILFNHHRTAWAAYSPGVVHCHAADMIVNKDPCKETVQRHSARETMSAGLVVTCVMILAAVCQSERVFRAHVDNSWAVHWPRCHAAQMSPHACVLDTDAI